MIHPVWALATLRHGQPDFVNVLKYKEGPNEGLAEFITNFNMHGVTREEDRTDSAALGWPFGAQRRAI